MFRKTLHILATALCLTVVFAADAQMKTGRWTSYAVSGAMNKIAETSDMVYFHLGPSLFSLSFDDNEFYTYSQTNKLSDTSAITGIWYCAEGGYLFVAYESGNIDVIYDNGNVVNMADIKDAVLSSGRTINDVAFASGRIYVATDFGIVVYDAAKNQVIESGIFNTSIDRIMVMGDRLVISIKEQFYEAPLDIRHNQLDKFTLLTRLYYKDLTPLDDTRFVYVASSDSKVYLATPNFEGHWASTKLIDTGDALVNNIETYSDGVAIYCNDKVLTYDFAGNLVEAMLPDDYVGCTTMTSTGLSSVWVDTADGIARMDFSAGTPTVTMQPFRPEAFTMLNPAAMTWSADGSRLYISNIGPSHHLAGIKGDGFEIIAKVCSVEDGIISDVMPSSVSLDSSPVLTNMQKRYNTTEIIGGPSQPVVDPDDKDIIYLPVRIPGVFVIKNGEVLNLFNSTNTPFPKEADEYQNVFLSAIDQDGNFWLGDGYNTPATIYVLPAEKRKSKIREVEKSDWIEFTLPASFEIPNRDYFVTFCRKSNYAFISCGNWGAGFVMMDNNGTPSNFRDDKFIHHTALTDQNSTSLTHAYTSCAVEDANGAIWVGTNQGVFVIDSPAKAMSNTLTVRRPIVPRNDGTQLGDYLLSTDKIQDIAVDPSNRKWIVTENSGAYLVSEDGTEIIANYNTSNSSLPSNCVYTVAADNGINKVYFGTSLGTVCFESDSSPAAEDYSEVYTYPNPVRPEYTGWITVAGLMDDSLVKIADAAGNVFYQGRSEGGMISWDGCDASGNRVRTGVYYVFVSQNATGTSSGAVAKILVVN